MANTPDEGFTFRGRVYFAADTRPKPTDYPRCAECDNGPAYGIHVHKMTEVVVFKDGKEIERKPFTKSTKGLDNGARVLKLMARTKRTILSRGDSQ